MPRAIDAFGAELIDRFRPLPEEVQYLLKIVYIKALCRKANVEKLDAGPKGGMVVSFRNGTFANGVELVKMIGGQGGQVKIRADQSVVFVWDWPTPKKRLNGVSVVLSQLVKLVEMAPKGLSMIYWMRFRCRGISVIFLVSLRDIWNFPVHSKGWKGCLNGRRFQLFCLIFQD